VVALAATLAGPAAAAAQSAQPAQSVEAAPRLLPAFGGFVFDSPVFVTHAGDGTGRLFVVEQAGTIRVVAGGRVLPAPFLDIRSLVVAGGEQGLLGLAFHPQFATNGLFYVYYTARPVGAGAGDNTVARYRVSATDPNRADPASGAVLLAIPDRHPNHNGGMLLFGPDGYLYVGTGDGGGEGDPDGNAQNLQSLLGKLLRLDVDGAFPYAIPPTNPFVGRPDARPEIWAYGLRNPWRDSFDRATGDLYIADVGQDRFEEVNYQRAGSVGGRNYGWNRTEGFHCYPSPPCDWRGITLPVAEYDHTGGNCSITGGYVYRGRLLLALRGAYLYGDFCSGRIWALRRSALGWTSRLLLDTALQISSFGEDEAGELLVADLASGRIFRLV
jgi:glucose/arabinose dehydrogenase